MAKYTITHACGHTSEISLFGKVDARNAQIARLEKHHCPACRATGSTLTGSNRQVAWAEDLRAAAMPKIEAAHAKYTAMVEAAPAPDTAKSHIQAAIDAARDAIMARTAARDWIDNRTPELDIYAAMQAAVRSAPRD